ncbi:MAG: hypothetical protein ACI4GA_04230 [Acutalibacteraceae bacterium]
MKNKIKQNFRSQFERFKNEIRLSEYIFWWICRLLMLGACVYAHKHLPIYLFWAVAGNTLATFAIPFFSGLFPQSLYFGRLPFRAQTYIDVFVIIGSFLGQCVHIGRYISFNDKWQHFIAGILAVFLGCSLMKAIAPDKELDKKQELCGGVGFSFFLMLVWEIFEFFADYFIKGSTNQDYNPGPINYNELFFKIFGLGAQNTGQYALYDTFFDILAATAGTVIAAVFFAVYKKVVSRKDEKYSAPKEAEMVSDAN